MMYVDNDVTHDFIRVVCRLKDGSATNKRYMIWKDKVIISHMEVDRLPGNVANGKFKFTFPRPYTNNSLKPIATSCAP
jgi:hypothetical protein